MIHQLIHHPLTLTQGTVAMMLMKITVILRVEIVNKIIIAHLNRNSIRNKFNVLPELITRKIDILFISETKINTYFPSPFTFLDFPSPFTFLDFLLLLYLIVRNLGESSI